MKINKFEESKLRNEFSALKDLIYIQRYDTEYFIKDNCPTLLNYFKERWGNDWDDVAAYGKAGSIKDLLHDLRND